MDSRKFTLPLNYEDFDPDYDQVQEPQVDTLLIYLPDFRKEQIRVQLTGTGILKISGQRRLEGNKWKRFFERIPGFIQLRHQPDQCQIRIWHSLHNTAQTHHPCSSGKTCRRRRRKNEGSCGTERRRIGEWF
nr:inactive protein RESTRICTED TEV MOVEMENT 2-like [Ipomoea batatas]